MYEPYCANYTNASELMLMEEQNLQVSACTRTRTRDPSALPFTLPTIDLATASGHPHSVDIAAFAGRHPPSLLTPN